MILVYRQVALADRIVLNKVDLVSQEDKDKLKVAILSINSVAQIVETNYAKCACLAVLCHLVALCHSCHDLVTRSHPLTPIYRVDLPFVLGINALDQAHVEATMAQYGGHSHVDPTVSCDAFKSNDSSAGVAVCSAAAVLHTCLLACTLRSPPACLQVRTVTFDVVGEVSEQAVEAWLEALLWESKLNGTEIPVRLLPRCVQRAVMPPRRVM